MNYCTRCTTPDTRPDVFLDEEKVCNACRFAERKKNEIDWDARKKEFERILGSIRSESAWNYDCIVPGSGGKDSIYVAHRMKHDYGMRPLLVTYPNSMYTPAGWKNFEIFRTRLGVDHITFTPNALQGQKLIKKFFVLYGDPYLSWSRAIHTIPVKIAMDFKIPLVVYGEPPAEYGGPEVGVMTSAHIDKYACTGNAKDLKLAGNWPELFDDGSVTHADLAPYMFPSQEELDKANLKAVQFGHYHYWDGYKNYLYCKEKTGFNEHEHRMEGSWMTFHSMDDKIDTYYQYLMLLKFGISRGQKESSPMIRNGHMTREDAVAKIEKYFYEFPYRYFNDCIECLEMDQAEFFGTLEKFRNMDIWQKVDGEWCIKKPIWDDN